MSNANRDEIALAEAPPASGGGSGLALAVIAVAQLMLVFDATILNIALPSIQADFNVAPADLTWLVTIYALVFGGLLLVGGRAGDLYGRRRVFRIGLVVFTLASLLGGLAQNETTLVVARALQGVGAAIAAPTALALIFTTFTDETSRNKALGIYGGMGGLGSTVGLLLGGVLTEYAHWRWVLLINVPLAVLVLVGTTVLAEGDRERGRMDIPGAVTATLGLTALVYAINRAGTEGWTDALTLGCFAAGAVLLVAFLAIQRSSPVAMMPLRIIRDSNRAGANLILFLVGVAMFAMFYFLTLYMQGVKGYSAMATGVAYLPFAVAVGLSAGALGPQLLKRLSVKVVTAIGLAFTAAGLVWFSQMSATSSYTTVLLPGMVVTGIGLGQVFVATTIAGVAGVRDEDTGVASGLVNISQEVGGALGLAVLATIAAKVTADATLPDSVTDGYSVAFLTGAVMIAAAIVIALLTIKAKAEDAKPIPGL
jgi:EmrB/QacA subfamily drug resistance transporter